MIKQKSWLVALIVGLGQAVLCLPAAADEEQKPEQISEQEIKERLEKVVFVPHDVGAPEVTDTGGVRSILKAPKPLALAPEHLSRSLSRSPTLYWYLSKATSTPIRFTLIKDDSEFAGPILELNLGTFSSSGIYALALSDYDIRLDENQRYFWSVTASPPGQNYGLIPASRTWIEHSPSADIQSLIASTSPFDQTVQLARTGYWFDAIDVVSRQIDTGEQTSAWHQIRARLLDQVGLEKVALFDRLQAGQ